MNFDVAKLIMDRDTTKKLGGIVAIDHYVKTPEQLNRDIELIAKQSGGSVVLGEFGAPIPDIHGVLSEEQQSEWIVNALELIAKNSHVVGLNYWVHMGGSTALWNPDISPRKAVISLTAYYNGK